MARGLGRWRWRWRCALCIAFGFTASEGEMWDEFYRHYNAAHKESV